MPRTEFTVASLLERVAELEEAIEPFAQVAGWFEHQRPMHSIITTGNGDVTVDDLLVARAVLADGVVLPRGREWSNELPSHLCPINLIEQYPRIVNFIALEWNNPTAVCKYLDDLLMDHHGTRDGFADEVRHELRILDDYCHRRLSPQGDHHRMPDHQNMTTRPDSSAGRENRPEGRRVGVPPRIFHSTE